MKKGLIQIMIANAITLVIGIVTNFLLPKYLSFESYAIVKTYALYLTYAGFFSLGYNDGMYLKYGGIELQKIDKSDFGKNFINYFILILIMMLSVLLFGIVLSDNVIIAFAFGIFSYNILGYLKSFYQATGEFKLYRKSLNAEKIIIFIFNIFLIFIFRSDNSNFYIWIQVLSGIFICIFLTLKLNSNIQFLRYAKLSFAEMKENIKSGFILMLGNFSSGVLNGIGRWFVKIFFSSVEFAKYSFATSMESIVNVFITPITIAMYNYFCKRPKLENVKKIKNASLIWGALVISFSFPAKFILDNYLVKYKSTYFIIFLLFAAQLFNIIIKGIYVNVYKSQKQQKKYLLQMIIMLIISVTLDYIFIRIIHNILIIGIAAFLTNMIWFIICEFEQKNVYRFKLNEYFFILLDLSIYFLLGYFMNPIIGFIVYLLALVILSVLLMKSTTSYLWNLAINAVKKMKKRKAS